MRAALLLLLGALPAHAAALMGNGGGVASDIILANVQTVTCADDGAGTEAAVNLDISASRVEITNSDTNGCDITVQETSAILGRVVILHVVSTAGGTVGIANVANVLTLESSPYEMAAGQLLALAYEDESNDLYREVTRSENLPLVGGTLTGGITFSGVTVDVASATSQDLQLKAGTGANEIILWGADVQHLDSGGTLRFFSLYNATPGFGGIQYASTPGGFWGVSTSGARGGVRNDQLATVKVVALGDLTDNATMEETLRIYGEGFVGTGMTQTHECPAENAGAAATETLELTSSRVLITNSDGDGCELTLLDAAAVPGVSVSIWVVSNAGGVVTLEDSANVVAATAACDTTGMTLGAKAECTYFDTADDLYMCSCDP